MKPKVFLKECKYSDKKKKVFRHITNYLGILLNLISLIKNKLESGLFLKR